MPRALTVIAPLALVLLAGPARSEPPAAAEPDQPEAEAPEPPPTWRFRQEDRPVKVVALAGSVGAWPKSPYAEQLQDMCEKVEVKNLAKTNYGAFQLKKRFQEQVIDNRLLNFGRDEHEFWLIFHGGLNSVAMPEQTNHHLRDLFVRAHRRGFKVVALTLAPWGDPRDKRSRGYKGLTYARATRKIVDFVLGKLDPGEALGSKARQRRDHKPDDPWGPEEKADIAVDLYHSALRDAAAPLRELEDVKAELARDPDWKKAHRGLDEAARARALARDAEEARVIPRFHMRAELRSFDHIHPNTEGHTIIARTICPQLPASWGCNCPPAPEVAAPAEDAAPALGLFGRSYEDWAWGLFHVLTGTVSSPADVE